MIEVAQEPLFAAEFSADTFGARNTGRFEANAIVALTDITGAGDSIRLAVTKSEGQNQAALAVRLPLGASGLAASASYGYLDYANIDTTGKLLGLAGHAHHFNAGLTYDLVRSRQFNLRLGADLGWSAVTDNSSAGPLQDKRLATATFSLSGDARDDLGGGGVTSWSAEVTLGVLDLSGVPTALAADAAGLMTDGGFMMVKAEVSRLQNLPGDFSLFGRLAAQWAGRNLDSSLDFALGGPSGVRGWPVGEASGDAGVLGTLELRYDLVVPDNWGEVQLAGLLDARVTW